MKKVGIWLNQKEADIITLENNALKYKTIYSDIETHERIPGESKQFGRFGDQFLSDEKEQFVEMKQHNSPQEIMKQSR